MLDGDFFTVRDTDRFSLITYDESVKTVFDLTPMTADHKAEKKDLIKRVVTGRMTNLCEGLLTGKYSSAGLCHIEYYHFQLHYQLKYIS